MGNEVIESGQDKPVQSKQVALVNPMQLMQIALESNADLDKLSKLMDLQERWESGQAKKSFYEAMANFQKNCPDIKKLKDGHNCKYAPLGDIVSQIRDLLADCGLSFRFEQDSANGIITITCVVTHKDGHSERTSMTAGADLSGNKNAIQGIGSTWTYLQRYTLIGALGITTADSDIDGRLPQDTSMVTNADQKILKIIRSRGESDADFFRWASNLLKKNVSSFDDLSEEQIQWFLRKMEGKK